jgi:hypothetical protein
MVTIDTYERWVNGPGETVALSKLRKDLNDALVFVEDLYQGRSEYFNHDELRRYLAEAVEAIVKANKEYREG